MKKLLKNKNKFIITLIASLIVVLLLIGIILIGFKGKKSELAKYVDNTVISGKKVSTYNAKISIIGNNISENYIVFNNGSKNPTLVFMKNISKKDEKHKYSDDIYKNTDTFLKGLYYVTVTNTTNDKIGRDTFTVKNFKINKSNINKMLKKFDFKSSSDCTGKTYIDKNNRIYLINYSCDDFNISTTYTQVTKTK